MRVTTLIHGLGLLALSGLYAALCGPAAGGVVLGFGLGVTGALAVVDAFTAPYVVYRESQCRCVAVPPSGLNAAAEYEAGEMFPGEVR